MKQSILDPSPNLSVFMTRQFTVVFETNTHCSSGLTDKLHCACHNAQSRLHDFHRAQRTHSIDDAIKQIKAVKNRIG